MVELIKAVLRHLPWGEVSSHTAQDIAGHLAENDVVQVVRCKDCRYFEKDKIHRITGVCTRFNTGIFTHRMEPYNFCSYGERNEGAENG